MHALTCFAPLRLFGRDAQPLIGCLKAMKGIHWLIYVVVGISYSKLVSHNVSLFFLNTGGNTIGMVVERQ